MNSPFSISRRERFIIVSFMGFKMHLFANMSLMKQLKNKLIKIFKKLLKRDILFLRKQRFIRGDMEWIRVDFESYLSGNIEDAYLKLIDGLDDKSIHIVSLVLGRIQKAIGIKKVYSYIDFEPCEYEREYLIGIYENFTNQVVKCGKDIWAYKNYLLPMDRFDPNVFYFKCGIVDLSASSGGGGGGKYYRCRGFYRRFRLAPCPMDRQKSLCF
jgi:hypothetical protein